MKKHRPVTYCSACSAKLYLVPTPRGGTFRYDAITLLPHKCPKRKSSGGDALYGALHVFVPRSNPYQKWA